MSTYRLWLLVGIGVLIAIAGVWPTAAQLPTYGVGRPPSAEEIKAWALTIPPDGQGLPRIVLVATLHGLLASLHDVPSPAVVESHGQRQAGVVLRQFFGFVPGRAHFLGDG